MRRNTLQEGFSAIPSIAVGTATICYALGLLIVNIYLNRYGVYTVDLVRSDFILVGAVFVFLVAVATFGVEHGKLVLRQFPNAWREKKLRTRARRLSSLSFQSIVAFVLTPAGALVVLSRYEFGWDEWRFWFSAFLLGGTGGHAADLMRQAAQIFRHAINKSGENAGPTLASQGYFALDVLLSLSISIASYALITYPHLAPAFGGGHRDSVLISATDEGITIAKHLKLPITTDGDIGPLRLLSDNENEIVVVAGDTEASSTRAVRISRQHVNAIIAVSFHIPNGLPSNDNASNMSAPDQSGTSGTSECR